MTLRITYVTRDKKLFTSLLEVLNQNKNGIPANSLAREIRDQFKNEVKNLT